MFYRSPFISWNSALINLVFYLSPSLFTSSLTSDHSSVWPAQWSHLSDHQGLKHGNKKGRHQEDHCGWSGLCSPGGQILSLHKVQVTSTFKPQPRLCVLQRSFSGGAPLSCSIWHPPLCACLHVDVLNVDYRKCFLLISRCWQCGVWNRPSEENTPVRHPISVTKPRHSKYRSGRRQNGDITSHFHLSGKCVLTINLHWTGKLNNSLLG